MYNVLLRYRCILYYNCPYIYMTYLMYNIVYIHYTVEFKSLLSGPEQFKLTMFKGQPHCAWDLRSLWLVYHSSQVCTLKYHQSYLTPILPSHHFFFLGFYLFFLREGEGDRGRKRERNINVQEKHRLFASHMPPTGDQACNTSMCPSQEWNWQPLGFQASPQSTE